MKFMALVLTLSIPGMAHGDLLCPKGSLSGLMPNPVWGQYIDRNSQFVNGWLRRLASNLAETTGARGIASQARAAERAGADNGRVMARMFEEGFIAATDIIYAHCYKIPDQEPWSKEIQKQRQAKWCTQWSDAHFCARR